MTGMKRRALLAFVVAALIAVLLLRAREPSPESAATAAPAAPVRAAAPHAAADTAGPKTAAARHPAPPSAPSAAPATSAPDGGAAASGNPAVFAGIVGFHNSFALSKALSLNAEAADQYLDKLCEQSRKLAEAPQFHDAGAGASDAAAYMAPRMDYEHPLENPPGALHLADDLRARISSYAADWPARISAADLAGLDFSWLGELARFDHWTVLSEGRLRDLPVDNALFYPIPNYSSLMAWAKLRYALGLRRGDAPAAAAEVRHLAELIRSQRLLISEMVSIWLLKADVRAREAAAASGADLAGWDPLDPAQLDRQRRGSFASMYFTYPGVREETLRKASGCMPAPCSALIEGVVAARSFGSFASRDNLPLIRELYASNGCEPALLERIGAARELDPGEALELAADDLPAQIAKHLGESSEWAR
jgi:hypothetical protein